MWPFRKSLPKRLFRDLNIIVDGHRELRSNMEHALKKDYHAPSGGADVFARLRMKLRLRLGGLRETWNSSERIFAQSSNFTPPRKWNRGVYLRVYT